MKSIQYEGVQLAYKQAGNPKNPAIIFLHGNSSNSHFFAPQLNSDLLKKYFLIAPDFLGHGESALINDYNYATPFGLAKSVVTLIETLGLNELIIYGVSLGGHVAMECIDLLGSQLKGVMVSGAPPLKNPLNLEEAFLPTEASALPFQNELSVADLDTWQEVAVYESTATRELIKEGILKTNPRYRGLLAEAVGVGLGFNNEWQFVEEYRGVIAFLHGEHEKQSPKSYVDSIRPKEKFKGETIVIPKSAHYPSIENTTVFNPLLKEFATHAFK